MAAEAQTQQPGGAAVETARGRRILRSPEAELQAAHRAGGDRGRERGHDAGHAGAGGFQTSIKDDVLDTIEEMIARLDEKLTAQMNEILHAPEFQQIESAWRGLNYLVFNSETDATLKIRVMNVSQERALSQPQALSRRALGPEPAVQGGLRAGVRPARRRALRLPGRRLSLQPCRRPTCSCCAISRKVAAAAHAPLLRRRRPDPAGHGHLDRAVQSARSRQGLRHAGLCGLEGPARRGRLAAMSACACRACCRGCPTAPSPSRSRSSPSRRTPTATRARNTPG